MHQDNTFAHECDTTRGDSGSAFLVRNGEGFDVIGVDSNFRSNPDGPFIYIAVSAASFQPQVADFIAGRTGRPFGGAGRAEEQLTPVQRLLRLTREQCRINSCVSKRYIPENWVRRTLRRWRAHQRADPALQSPYLTPEWAQIVGAVRKDARVCVIDDGAGFFAAQRLSRFAAMGLGAPIADYQGLLSEPGLRR